MNLDSLRRQYRVLVLLAPFANHLHINIKIPYHPHTGDFMSSDTPKDIEPMKSLRVVLSQSHTSTDSRRSLSAGFSLLEHTSIQDEALH